MCDVMCDAGGGGGVKVSAFSWRSDVSGMERVFSALLSAQVKPDASVYGALMRAFNDLNDPAAVVRCFEHMIANAVPRDVRVYNTLLHALAVHTHHAADLNTVRPVLCCAVLCYAVLSCRPQSCVRACLCVWLCVVDSLLQSHDSCGRAAP
jgi:hypothetical protein